MEQTESKNGWSKQKVNGEMVRSLVWRDTGCEIAGRQVSSGDELELAPETTLGVSRL